MKISSFIFVSLFLLGSCTSTGNRKGKDNPERLPYHIDLTKFHDRDLVLSDFADDVSYIRLESGPITVGGRCYAKPGRDCFIILDNHQQLLAFSKDGKFLNRIGRLGKGPGEYPFVPPNFQIDAASNVIMVPCDYKEADTYNIQGQFLRNIIFPEFWSDAIVMVNSRIYLSPKGPPANSYIRLEEYQLDGEKIKEYAFRMPKLDGTPIYSPFTELSVTPENDVIVNSSCHDTTFIVTKGGEWKPYIVYNRGSGKMPEPATFFRLNKDDFPDNYYPMFLKDMGEIIIMANRNGKEGRFCYFIKETGELFRLDINNTPESPDWLCIQNDLDGVPGLYYHHNINGNYLYCVHQAIDLIEWKKTGYFERIEPIFPEKKQALLAMIDSLKPDDNPVIMVVKLKD
jgi:hypothetical protein